MKEEEEEGENVEQQQRIIRFDRKFMIMLCIAEKAKGLHFHAHL